MADRERAARWLRVSSTGQDEVNQEPDINRMIAEQYADTGITYRMRKSASKGKHQAELDAVLADARAGKFDVLVAWLPDRLERRGGFRAVAWLQSMLDAGVNVVFAEPTRGPRYDTSTTRGQEEIFRSASYAAEESELRMTRINAGRATAKANGGILTAAPFGYKVTGPKHHKRFEATAEGREWIPVVFERARAASLYKLAGRRKRLEPGIQGPLEWIPGELKGTPLEFYSTTALAKVLRNTTYLGTIKSRDGRVIGHCEALIKPLAFKQAQAALASRPRTGGRLKGSERVMLAGVAYCPTCPDSPLWHDVSMSNGRRYDYLRCEKCRMRVPMGKAERTVEQIVSTFNKEITTRVLVEQGHDWSEEIAKVERDLLTLAGLGLDEDEEDERRRELRALKRDYASREATQDVYEDVPTGVTYAAEFARLRPSERGEWLRSHVRVWIDKKTVTLIGLTDISDEMTFENWTDMDWSLQAPATVGVRVPLAA